MKRIRDEDGNVIGYGDAIPADVKESSITGKRGIAPGLCVLGQQKCIAIFKWHLK